MNTVRLFSALTLTVLVTVLCVVTGPVLMACYALGGLWRGAKEIAVAWWSFASMPWRV